MSCAIKLGQGACYRSRRRHQADLADALGSERPFGLVLLDLVRDDSALAADDERDIVVAERGHDLVDDPVGVGGEQDVHAETLPGDRRLVEEMGAEDGQVKVDSFDGLLVNYARNRGAQVILRGLRAVADFEYELQMANMNRHLNNDIETVCIMADDAYFYVASTLVKEVARLGGDVSDLVPSAVQPRLLAKFDK